MRAGRRRQDGGGEPSQTRESPRDQDVRRGKSRESGRAAEGKDKPARGKERRGLKTTPREGTAELREEDRGDIGSSSSSGYNQVRIY